MEKFVRDYKYILKIKNVFERKTFKFVYLYAILATHFTYVYTYIYIYIRK